MHNSSKPFLALFFVLFICNACAARPAHERESAPADSKKDTITVMSSGSEEECVELKKGQILTYKFTSSRPVDFNIHYHGTDQIHYPASQSELTDHEGTIDPEQHSFYIEEQTFYCLMWENPGMNSARISYEYAIKEK
ncbi:MAG: hypothetical protein HY808_16500 [Nitrospirae bacterium]|nr:hypothetical protein [Nitrospirota bacterium]